MMIPKQDLLARQIRLCLDTLDEKFLARWLKQEQPQTIAFILSLCDAKKSSYLLKHLPEGIQTDVLVRLKELDSIHELELKNIYEELVKLQNKQDHSGNTPDGFEKILSMMKSLPASESRRYLENLEQKDPQFATKLRASILTVERLSQLHPNHLSLLCSKASDKDLSTALRLETKEIQEKYLGALSQKRRCLIEEDLEIGKIPKKEAESAASKIVKFAIELEETGKIIFPWDDALV